METVASIDWWCNNCGGIGNVSIAGLDLDETVLVICSHCSHPIVYAWCEKCGAGVKREEIDFTAQPKTWICPECKTEYKFPLTFYRHPIYFHPTGFSELVYYEGDKYFRKYEYVNISWLRKTLLFWDEHSLIALGISVILCAISIGWFFLPRLTTHMTLEKLISLILLSAFFSPFSAALISLIFKFMAKIFFVIYKIRNKQV